MPTIRFKAGDVSAVYLGRRKQLIMQRCRFKKDDRLYLCTADTRRRLRSTKCEDIKDVHISSSAVIILNNRVLTDDEKNKFILKEGFDSLRGFMLSFKRCGLPYKGHVVTWL